MAASQNPFSTIDTEHGERLDSGSEQTAWIAFGLFVLGLTYCYLNMLTYTSTYWSKPLYSHGWIIPLFAAYLFYMRYKPLEKVEASERWIGVGILVASLAVRLYASYYDMNPFDRLSYLGALLGVTQMIGGRAMLWWAGPPLAFLFFMFPLPSVLENTVLVQLQRVAAIASTATLQTLGLPALRDGSRIQIDQIPLDVADACSGLRMSTIFGAMAVAVAMMARRPWWDRFIILLSAIPIALVTNVIRITITALLYTWFPENEALHRMVHDWAGLAMMPIALGFLGLELLILSAITVRIEDDDYAAFGAAGQFG